MNILIYMGQSQYAAFNLFADQLTEPFKKKGHSVILFDLTQEGSSKKLIELFSSTHIDLVIAFNGMGVELTSGNKSIYDIVKTTFLAIFVDHPIYHISRLSQPVKNYIATFLDESHVDFVDDLLPTNQVIKYFMPLAGSSDDKSCLNSYSEYLETKDIEILFTGSYFGTPTKIWDNNANLPRKFLNQISELLIHDDYTTIAEALKKVLGRHNIKLSHNFKQKNTSLMSLVMSYVRQYKRNELITKLCQHGLPITIYGKSWETMAKEFSTVTFKGDVCAEETIALTKRAKIIINTNANFTHGAHDRVFTGICNGTVVFTDKSTFYDKRFVDEKDILYYSFNSLDQDIDKLKLYINDNEKLYNMATKCYGKIQNNDLWEHRATLIEDIFNYCKILSRIE